MDRALDSLSSDFRPLVDRLLAKLVERGVMVMICQTSRTPDEAAANLANGTSATSHSKHLPRKLRGVGLGMTGTPDDDKADAIDLCPYDVYQLVGPDKLQWTDDVKGHPAFAVIQDVGETLAMRSGAPWKAPHDPGHLEFLFPGERHADIPTTSAAFPDHGVVSS